ncbi:glycine betaine ABC transporter substrate-binding protein [Texcoconibacillus texcoconensis]|uniref:Glycine betaine/proline transport system substrate-binding protein n=1 Tax=Texcoconibacillus texcoconensis TaxID=1095777 RepID=A0A840QLT1_9BACI|nr:glycine betaine ABC transporter substrate-binding protein [Texcoconibacillus texcoconensis]MBB5172327.1 glycine betaine/proline transport system substrate-binding protein [Texcoconibacillus texcoconensis]
MNKKMLGLSVFATLSVGVLAACGGEAETSEGNPSEEEGVSGTIEFGVTPWTSTVPPTEVAGLILEEMGYEVEQTQADAGAVYTGLSRGDLDVYMDGWFPMHDNYLDEFGDSLDETAVSYTDAETGWTVPTYVEEINHLDDIKGNEDLFDGQMFGIEEGATATENTRTLIEEEELDIEQVVSSEGGMLSEAARKIPNEEPIVFFGWRPHTMFNNYDLKVLEGQEEYHEPSDVKVITNGDLAEEKPEAYAFLSNWSMSIDDIEAMIVEIEEEGRDEREVAQDWIDDNQDIVGDWLNQ